MLCLSMMILVSGNWRELGKIWHMKYMLLQGDSVELVGWQRCSGGGGWSWSGDGSVYLSAASLIVCYN